MCSSAREILDALPIPRSQRQLCAAAPREICGPMELQERGVIYGRLLSYTERPGSLKWSGGDLMSRLKGWALTFLKRPPCSSLSQMAFWLQPPVNNFILIRILRSASTSQPHNRNGHIKGIKCIILPLCTFQLKHLQFQLVSYSLQCLISIKLGLLVACSHNTAATTLVAYLMKK